MFFNRKSRGGDARKEAATKSRPTEAGTTPDYAQGRQPELEPQPRDDAGLGGDVDLSAHERTAAMTQAADTTKTSDALTEEARQTHFYVQPEPLSATAHGALGIAEGRRSFGYARRHHLVPIALGEFALAARHYPIVFVGEKRLPCVVMGFQEGENLFIDENGAVADGVYVPAYLRQYPFLLARHQSADPPILFIDRASDLVVENGGHRLFVDGQPSQFSKDALGFLTSMQQQWRQTEAFCASLDQAGLLTVRDLKLAQRGGKENVAEPLVRYNAVDMDKVHALPGDRLADLASRDLLKALYAHHFSLLLWSELVGRAYRRRTAVV